MGTFVDTDAVISGAVQTSPSGQNTFEAFVKNAIQKIQREAWGRSAEVVEIRNSCQTFFDHLNSEEGGAKLGVPFDEQRTRAALEPLRLACNCSIVRIVEPALGCLHKLVAYAWVQGESSDSGNMNDETLVTEIVAMVVKCIQLGNPTIYLSVIRALLTFATADHFVAHGHCLLHMVRTVFNLAVSCDESNLKRTACNALLQMLNTVVKRVVVTQFQTRFCRSRASIDSTTQDGGMLQEEEGDETGEVAVMESDVTPPTSPNVPGATTGTWKLADLAEKQDIEALEAAFENKQRVMEESVTVPVAESSTLVTSETGSPLSTKPDPQETPTAADAAPSKPARRPKGWDQLTLLEKDVLVVLMAFCKLAGVNTSSVTSENYVRHGKLLALELLVKVFENPGHRWANVRLAFCEQLRFPLCLVLIRNCNPIETKAFQFAIRLFVSVIMQLQIRLGLKAELGALYPLLLLRPLEATVLDPVLLTVTLTGVKRIAMEPQMQVDLFINYDCNLKAPNLYERTAKALSHLAVFGDPNAPPNQSTLLREAASACTMAMLTSLDAWAGPVRDAAHVGEFGNHPGELLNSSADGNGSIMGSTSEVRHFGAAKERKNSMNLGIDLFNRNPAKGIASLVASGVVLNKPDTIASFLRKNRDQFDLAMLGEYLGLHDDMPLKVMHAYIDMEHYQHMTIDTALRKLLSQFRLPGEAQKIDRIMEKFAERYCQDNPGAFQCADDAYVLSFSLIMLNTDMHNPMAEKRLTKQDFVSMNMRQRSDGVYVEVLSVSELKAMFDRIAADEIRTVHAKPGLTTRQEEALAQHRNLASAVGLTQLALPFRSGQIWDKVRGAQIEHEHLLALTQKAMRSGAVDAELWFSATHTEHSRPMFEVSGPYFQKALAAAVESSLDKESAQRSVDSLVMAIQLAALLGLDQLCQQFVTTLSRAIGVHSKEALLRANPHRQIAALRAMIGVASDEQAGLLGSSWTTILRTISSVEALISDMRRGHQSNHSVFEESMQSFKAQQPPGKIDADKSTALGRFFTQIGLSKSEAEGYNSVPPGQAIRVWSGGEGITEMDRVFVRSASLDGEAVVHFCKALCTVSQDELNPAIVHPDGSSPRVFSLRKLVECAYYNLGRIRLIWGRLWSTISSHLVDASCHSDQTVAMYSVDSLRQLVGKLLSRDELVNFTTQSDTLWPFVIVLKQCANVVVRELAVQCIEQAMNAHSSRLGSGWVVILEFLSVASLDPAPSVTRQCIDTLQSVVNVHWRKWGRGRDALADCVTVALRVARNPHNTDCSLRAIQLVYACAKELVTELQTSEQTDEMRSASMEYLYEEDEEKTMKRAMSVPSGPPQYPRKEIPVATEPLLSSSALWTVIFEALVEVMTREERRRCADSAADILFKLPSSSTFSSTWNQQTWTVFQFAVRRIFDIKEDAYAVESGLDRILSYSASFFPGLFSVITNNYETAGKSLLAHLLEILMVWMTTENQAMALSGVYLLQEMVNFIANELDEEGWSIVIARLQCAWNLCATHGKDGLAFVSWVEGDEPLSVEAMRIRCQVLIALQRVLHQMYETLEDKIPKNLIPKLIEILMRTVQQTAEVNSHPDVLKKFQQSLISSAPSLPQNHVEKTAGADSPQNKAPADSPQLPVVEQEVQEIEEEQERTASETSEKEPRLQEESNEDAGPSVLPALKTEFSQAPPLPPQDSVHSQDLSVDDSIPELCTELISNEHTIFCGLLRIHVEGGMLTIRALRQRCQQEVDTCDVTAELLNFCRSLIIQASSETRTLVADARDGSEVGSLQSQWEQAVKAPLVAAALEAYKDVEHDMLAVELKELVPHLSMLICNPQPTIRRAIGKFMKTKTHAVLNLDSPENP